MLAADISPWHNAALPGDVDGDGKVDMADVELLMGELRATGARALGGTSQAMGGMEGESPLYLDVTNDGMIGGSDLTQLVNMLLMEGEENGVPELEGRPAPAEYRADFEFFIYDASGDNVLATNEGTANLNVGDFFTFQVMVANTSDDPSGILSAFIDVTYDSSLVTVVDPEGEQLGPGFSSEFATGAGIPNNIIPGDSTGEGVDGLLRAMGGTSLLPTVGANGQPVKLFSLQFQVIGAGGFSFEPVFHQVENPDVSGEFFTQVSYEPNFINGAPADQNLTATTFVDMGPSDDGLSVVANFPGPIIVSLNLSDDPVFGANPDFYQVGENFDESLVDENLPQEIPPIVIIDGEQWAVLDVLANDGDEDGNEIPLPRDRFNITGIDTSININLEDAAALEARLRIEFIADHPELQDMGFSHQVILYQVPTDLSSPPNEVFTYTIEDTEDGNLERETALVSITVRAAPTFTLTAGDLNVVGDDALEQGEVFEFNIFDLVTATGNPDEGEELTLDEFIGTEALQGTFIDLEFEEGYGPGWFRYIAPDMALIESFQYQVSFAGLVETGTITIETLSNTLIQGIVYFDVNNDGMWNDNANNEASPERKIGGVAIELLQDGAVVGETVTNANGEYRFVRIDPGTYSVRVVDPRFVIKGKNSEGLFEDTISGIVLEDGAMEQALGVNFGYRGREVHYRGIGDFFSSNTEDSIMFAMSKSGGQTSLEWYSVDMGWDRLVSIRPDLVFYNAQDGFGQIAFEVTVEGHAEPMLVVHTFSTSSPDFKVLAETSQGLIFRFSGAAMDVLTNLAALDAAYVDY